MLCSFRFVPDADPHAVTLRLFRLDDSAMAEVTGPLLRSSSDQLARTVDRCIAWAADGFDLAIRIANAADTEVVVTGDRTLWEGRWGTLTAAPSPGSDPLAADRAPDAD